MPLFHILKRPAKMFRAALSPEGAYASGSSFGGLVFSITRSTTGTYKDSGGVWQTAGANTLRVAPEGLLVEPLRQQFYPTPTAPAAGTTASLATGNWIFWVEGSGSQAISAGTAVGTGWGTASQGSPVVISVTSAGTATLAAVTGSLSRAQLETAGTSTAFATAFIPTASATRNADVITAPFSFGGSLNRWTVSGLFRTAQGRAWAQNPHAYNLWSIGDSGANTAWLTQSNATLIFSVIDGANVQKYVNLSNVTVGALGTAHHYITCVNDNGTLAVYIDGVAASGTIQGTGTGLWSSQQYTTMQIGSRAVGGFFGGHISNLTIRASANWAQAYEAPAPAYRVACLGDSITAGSAVTVPYPTTVQGTFGVPWIANNFGVNSDTTTLMLARWPAIRAQGHGRLVYLGGINDIRLNQSLATAQAQTAQILSEAAASGMSVVALSLLPAGGSAAWDATKNTNRLTFNSWLSALCVAQGYTFVDSATDFDDGSGNLKAAYDSGDHLHPSQAGADRLAALVAAAIPH